MDDTKANPGQPGFDLRYLGQLAAKAHEARDLSIPTAGLGEGLPDKVPVIWDHAGQRLVSVRDEIERYRLRPERRSGRAGMLTLDSFVALVNRHKDEHSAVFGDTDWRAPSLMAVIDYHETGGTPRHMRHRIAYAFPLSEEWKAWREGDGQAMGQGEFAAFVEDRIAELTAPDPEERKEFEKLFQTKIAAPNELILLSRGLQVCVGQNVKNASTLQSGEAEIVFEETHHDAKGNRLVVPGLFMLSLPIFFGGERVRVPVRLRYRVKSGAIVWFFQMYRPDLAVTQRVRDDLAAVAEQTGLPVYEGAPEA